MKFKGSFEVEISPKAMYYTGLIIQVLLTAV